MTKDDVGGTSASRVDCPRAEGFPDRSVRDGVTYRQVAIYIGDDEDHSRRAGLPIAQRHPIQIHKAPGIRQKRGPRPKGEDIERAAEAREALLRFFLSSVPSCVVLGVVFRLF